MSIRKLLIYLSSFFIFLVVSSQLFAERKKANVWNVPIKATPFYGRRQYLKEIKDNINKGIVVISGISGIGKTSLVLNYAYKKSAYYDIIWYFSSSSNFDEQYVDLAHELNNFNIIPSVKFNFPNREKYTRFCKNFLVNTNKKYLLIFEDIHMLELLLSYIPELLSYNNKNIIVTSLNTQNVGINIKLKRLERSESIELLKKEIGNGYSEESYNALAESLGDHPYALKNAVSTLKGTPESFIVKTASYFKGEEIPTVMKKSIEPTINKLEKESPEALELLYALSLINYYKIEKDLIEKWFDGNLEKYLEALKTLSSSSLLDIENVSGKEYGIIHKFTAEHLKKKFSEKEKAPVIKKMSKILLTYFSHKNIEEFVAFMKANPNFTEHLKRLINQDANNQLDIGLKVNFLYYIYYYAREYDEASKLANIVEKYIEAASPPPSIELARYNNMKMKLKPVTLQEGIAYSLKAKEQLESLKGSEAREELLMLLTNNLPYYYLYTGETDKAASCSTQANEILKSNPSAKYDILNTLLNVLINFEKGDFNKVKATLDNLDKKLETSTIKEDLDFYAYALRASYYLKISENKKALESANLAYAIALKKAGAKDHEIVGRGGMFLAEAENRAGNFPRALEIIDQTIAAFNKSYLGEEKNSRQAYAHLVRGNILCSLEKFDEAFKAYQKSLSIYKKIYVNFATDDYSELLMRLFTYYFKTKDEFNLKEMFREHSKKFGLNHPRSLEMAKEMDNHQIKLPRLI